MEPVHWHHRGGLPNILILGASGQVAAALLRRLLTDRDRFGRLILVDRSEGLLQSPFLPHGDLRYDFIRTLMDVRADPGAYLDLLRQNRIDMVLDLSIHETRPILEATDSMGISYINTGIVNRRGEDYLEVAFDLYRRRHSPWHAPHVLCTGMNPGIVNMWVRKGIEEFGRPEAIIHFEVDTGEPKDGWQPMIPWSRENFLDEIVNDPGGYMEGRDKVKLLYPNPLKNSLNMETALRPLMNLTEYPRGYCLLHEENITLAQSYDLPSRFLYAIHPRTMDFIEDLYDRERQVPVGALRLGDNRTLPLKGSDTIGVLLRYADQWVYFVNSTSHQDTVGSSASCYQVAAGIHATLLTLLRTPLPNHIHFVEDLFDTACEGLMREYLPVEQIILAPPHNPGQRRPTSFFFSKNAMSS